MKNEQLPYWLILNHVPGLGPATITKLLQKFKTPKAVMDNITSLEKLRLPKEIISSLKQPNWPIVDEACRWAEQDNQHIITLADAEYPALLKEIPNPPPVLYIKGQRNLLGLPQIAIVGSRNPSPAGLEIAEEFARSLSAIGFCITSGLALGIDAASHRGALQASGKTIAVLGCGLHTIYPKRHLQLAQSISQTGCLLSEFPLNASPMAAHFPQRNRIISGLSIGTLVVEARPRSGSLITARFANEQGREVFAVPGSIRNPLSHGCHKLLQEGAKLVDSIEDILNELGTNDLIPPQNSPDAHPPSKPEKTLTSTQAQHQALDKEQFELLECVGFELTSIDQLIERSQFSASTVMTLLLILELHGYIISIPGGYQRAK